MGWHICTEHIARLVAFSKIEDIDFHPEIICTSYVILEIEPNLRDNKGTVHALYELFEMNGAFLLDFFGCCY